MQIWMADSVTWGAVLEAAEKPRTLLLTFKDSMTTDIHANTF